jgi:hypothetical protein
MYWGLSSAVHYTLNVTYCPLQQSTLHHTAKVTYWGLSNKVHHLHRQEPNLNMSWQSDAGLYLDHEMSVLPN